VVWGPKYQKFREARELLACGGGYTVDSPEAFGGCIDLMVRNKEKRLLTGKAAGDFVLNNSGATERIVERIFKI
jgi:3-deoxy-D-manno-octulosonic-acid transferase